MRDAIPLPPSQLPATPEPPTIDDPYPRLSPRHQRFIDALIANGGNQKQAYLSAGYASSPESAAPDASRLLTDANVRLAYELRLADLAARAHVSQEQLLASLNVDAFATRTAIYEPSSWITKPMHEWPEALQRAVDGVDVEEQERTDEHGTVIRTRKIKIRFPSRLKAKELLGEHLGLWQKAASGRHFNLEINVDASETHQQVNYVHNQANTQGNNQAYDHDLSSPAASPPLDLGPLTIDMSAPDASHLSTPSSPYPHDLSDDDIPRP